MIARYLLAGSMLFVLVSGCNDASNNASNPQTPATTPPPPVDPGGPAKKLEPNLPAQSTSQKTL